MKENIYNKNWFNSRYYLLNDYKKISNSIFDIFNPTSVLDIGCGNGLLINFFYNKGIDILGVDFSEDAINMAINNFKIPKENFLIHDLKYILNLENKYDVEICLEVAEHIEEIYSDILVRTLCCNSNKIIFSSAPPGQGGHGHINEKPFNYWFDKFYNLNFYRNDEMKIKLFENINLDYCRYLYNNLNVFILNEKN